MVSTIFHKKDEKLVLIDTDAGLDDCLAILMALQAHKDPSVTFRVIGISCVNGNTEVDNVCLNVTRILEVANLSEVRIRQSAVRRFS
jgi:pyrimidine-specific ribonucleoside hydrolase